MLKVYGVGWAYRNGRSSPRIVDTVPTSAWTFLGIIRPSITAQGVVTPFPLRLHLARHLALRRRLRHGALPQLRMFHHGSIGANGKTWVGSRVDKLLEL
jgi:hypothetical protein